MIWLSACLLLLARRVSAQTSMQSVAEENNLTASITLPFPSTTMSLNDTHAYMRSYWNLSPKLITTSQHLTFVDDPFPDSSVGGSGSGTSNGTSLNSTSPDNNGGAPVLQVTYQNGSYTSDGGSQWYSLWNGGNNGLPLQTVLLSYELAFPNGYNWVKGGKLPGLRGGSDVLGCNGGRQSNGSDCFSMRLMWRPGGEGEVYAYVPMSNDICSNGNFTCSDGYGTSIQRGAYKFTTGQWNRVSMLVQLNDPPEEANGIVLLYFNDDLVIEQGGLIYRNNSAVNIGGFFFSTFFGGHTSDWATPVTAYSYYRNIQMWGSTSSSSTSMSNSTDAAS